MYRTHKSVPPPAKISSLYVFDALSRAARSHVNKKGVSGDSKHGNAATFLSKIEGVLEGLFQDMVDSGMQEAKVSVSFLSFFSGDLPHIKPALRFLELHFGGSRSLRHASTVFQSCGQI
jgi:hypothetical protein